jgi:hypothetical protein
VFELFYRFVFVYDCVLDDQKARVDATGETVNWSAIAQRALKEVVINLAVRKETATMDDVVEPPRASKQSYVEIARAAGADVGEEWAKHDAEYHELLRIATAVDARREIDIQALQDLIDPKHKIDRGDWVSFWEDRGFSGACEPSDMWGRAFADGAARLFEKVRGQP